MVLGAVLVGANALSVVAPLTDPRAALGHTVVFAIGGGLLLLRFGYKLL